MSCKCCEEDVKYLEDGLCEKCVCEIARATDLDNALIWILTPPDHETMKEMKLCKTKN